MCRNEHDACAGETASTGQSLPTVGSLRPLRRHIVPINETAPNPTKTMYPMANGHHTALFLSQCMRLCAHIAIHVAAKSGGIRIAVRLPRTAEYLAPRSRT